jgi:hypothetical protein
MLLVADTPRKLVPKLKAELMARAIGRKDHVLHLHSAAVLHEGRLLLLPGSSGSGKTVLTAQLLSLGAVYFSDEAVLLRRDGTVPPIPTALSVKSDGLEALKEQFPGLPALPEHDREDGVTVRYLPPPPASLPSPAQSERPALILFPRYERGAAPGLRRISAPDALARLLDECLAIPRRLDFEGVATMVETVERASCWELATREANIAALQVIELMESPDSAGRST